MKLLHVSIALVGLAGIASADNLRASLEASNHAIHKAMMKKDMAGFLKATKPYVTSDFVYSENGQKMNFDQMVENMKAGMGMMQKMTSASSKILKCKEMGDKGTATMMHKTGGVMMGQDKKPHTMIFSGTADYTFRKEGGKWKMATMTWGKQTATLDGKPMDMATMGAPTGSGK